MIVQLKASFSLLIRKNFPYCWHILASSLHWAFPSAASSVLSGAHPYPTSLLQKSLILSRSYRAAWLSCASFQMTAFREGNGKEGAGYSLAERGPAYKVCGMKRINRQCTHSKPDYSCLSLCALSTPVSLPEMHDVLLTASFYHPNDLCCRTRSCFSWPLRRHMDCPPDHKCIKKQI